MNRPAFQDLARPVRFFPALGVCGRQQRGFSVETDLRTRFAPWVRGFVPRCNSGEAVPIMVFDLKKEGFAFHDG